MVQHISAKEVDESKDENAEPHTKPSIFDRLQPSTSRKRPSIFTRIRKGQNPKSFVFWRVNNHTQPKPSMLNKMTKGRESSNPLPQEQNDLVSNQIGEGTKYKVLSLLT